MKSKYLFDTDLIIDHLRGYRNLEDVLRKFKLPRYSKYHYVSVVTRLEVFSGKSSRNPQIYDEAKSILELFRTIPLSSEMADKAGEFRRDIDLNVADAVIAATTCLKDMVLVTRNKKHFQKVPDLKILSP